MFGKQPNFFKIMLGKQPKIDYTYLGI